MNAAPKSSFNWPIFSGLVLVATLLSVALPNWVPPLEIQAANPCVHVLRELNAAKAHWASEYHAATNDVPSWIDLAPYLSRTGSLDDIIRASAHQYVHPTNTYVLGDLKTPARCRVNPRHALPAPGTKPARRGR